MLEQSEGKIYTQDCKEVKHLFDLLEKSSDKNYTDLEKFLMNENNDFWNMKTTDNQTILHKTCFKGDFFLTKLIIDCTKNRLKPDENLKINRESSFSDTKNILTNFINSKTEANGLTPLHYASFRGDVILINYLIENGADPHAKTTHGISMMHMAAKGNQPSSIIYFNQKYNIPLDQEECSNMNPLHLAAIHGADNAAIYLLSLGVDPNKTDKDGFTPLHYAVKQNQERITKKLLQKGASNLIRDNKRNKTPSEYIKNNDNIMNAFREKGLCERLFIKPTIKKSKCANKNMFIFIFCLLFIFLINFFFLFPFFEVDIVNFSYLGLTMIIFIMYTWLRCSNPGKMENSMHETLLSIAEKGENLADYCPYCKIKKEYRSMHCLICDYCVCEFDHHCFWVGNCVGKNNYNLFFTFLISMLIYMIVTIAFDAIYFALCVSKDASKIEDASFPYFLFGAKSACYNKIFRIIFGAIILLICISFFIPLIQLFRLQCKTFQERREMEREEKEYQIIQLKQKFDEEEWEDMDYKLLKEKSYAVD